MARVRSIKILPKAEALMVTSATKSAADTLGEISKGIRICGVTKGQFSLLDIIRAILDQTGPADVQLTTWTSGIRDAQTAAWLLNSGVIRSFRMITDRSFPIREPDYCNKLLELFGEESIVCSRIHCKVAIIQNENWSVVIRSSMNLNRNPRFEQFDLDEGADFAKWWCDLFDEVRSHMEPGFRFGSEEVPAAFEAALRQKKEEADNRRRRGFDIGSDFEMNLDDLLGGIDFG